ncbi:UDP-forming cellulose synthase catalytic subunit [Acidicapsa acidisoli]|uniref:UDP-forming cellulose synthase catalytic subunit n=1 Tax=Acidicapsa acidisoli TaxID=1615681 RepID=UPI0021E02B1F|nr:UDP-forming cellulose synthase catalytic subunit [Acidicapsa acidisoli]
MGVSQNSFGTRLFRILVLLLTAFLVFQLISLDLSWPKQAVLGVVCLFLALGVNRYSSSQITTFALMSISMTATFRYGWWRFRVLIEYFSDESNHRLSIDSVLMLILMSAEVYTMLIMVLGYMQTAWPLKRVPVPMPNDESLWPHVDVLIPTYNEPLSLVRYTSLAAHNIDYPPEKLHVYILDDGTREDFREFAREAGIGYVTRVEHKHAKAGNINHALTTMSSEYVSIFDCDHVPTRSFLQMTLGWMLVDRNLGMLQTPHHFYSPDPFERNLLQYKTIPNEAALFYGIIQDGNDFWNATFFCGSCALIRRSALEAVGGIATETVTEDAHTSLRMQKLGYNTAYINIPQAAGLATETLAAHIGQRIRWARGMIQIFRTDNPLLARGMKFTQRLCYLNAMIHFLYAVPRLVFLGAPLVYMLIGRTIIPGYWLAILAYAIPHLILSSLTNSRIQGRHRHSFWNEIYESVLAPYILAPTLLALVNPKLGKFNVTDKGSTLSQTHFDSKIATPTRWMLFINVVGLLVAPYRLLVTDAQHPGTVIMNLVWIVFNIVILGVAAAVAHEQKQRRTSVRIEARIPMRISMLDGSRIDCISSDMSVGGASVQLQGSSRFVVGESLRVAFPEHAGDAEIGARVVALDPGEVRLAFLVPTIAEQETLTRALYSRADAWISSLESKEVDRPLRSLARVISLSRYGIYQICRDFFPEKRRAAKSHAAQTAAMLLLMVFLGSSCHLFGATPAGKPSVDAYGGAEAQKVIPSAVAVSGSDESSASEPSTTANVQVLSLQDMGLTQPVEMRGPHSYSSVGFTLPYTLVPRQATLKLIYSFDPALDTHSGSLAINLNGTRIGVLQPTHSTDPGAGFAEARIAVPSDLLLRTNSLVFEFAGSGIMQREEEARAHILCRISPGSALEVDSDRLQWQNDLSQLPLPIFDSDLQSSTTVPIVFLSQPSLKTLQASGAIASWLGLLAGSKPVRFGVSIGTIPPGNAILFSANRSTLPSSLRIPVGSGPILALRSNPTDSLGSILVIAGDDDQQLLSAARTLSLTKRATPANPAQGLPLVGDTMHIPDLTMPLGRSKGDAPRWMPTNRAAPLASCQLQQSLRTDGSTPVPVYFHLPPDLFYGERENLKLHLDYRYNALQAAPGSALRVVVNGTLINEIELLPGTDFVDRQRTILLPVANLRPFGNTILFNFDFIPANHAPTQNPASANPQGEILCKSSLDTHGLASWTSMPNLELFADAGFPFTQMADLSETTVVLPETPSTDEVSLYLHLMSHFGAQTGYPALGVTVDGPNAVVRSDRDYLVLGTIASQPAFRSLNAILPVAFESDGIHLEKKQDVITVLSSLEAMPARWWSKLNKDPVKPELPSNASGMPDALIEEIKSPSSLDRSIVVIALKDNTSADAFATVLLDRSHSGDIAYSVSLLRNSAFESYPVDVATYHVGNISSYAIMRIWLTQHFMLLLISVTLLSFLVAIWTREWLSQRARERLKLAEGVISVS